MFGRPLATPEEVSLGYNNILTIQHRPGAEGSTGPVCHRCDQPSMNGDLCDHASGTRKSRVQILRPRDRRRAAGSCHLRRCQHGPSRLCATCKQEACNTWDRRTVREQIVSLGAQSSKLIMRQIGCTCFDQSRATQTIRFVSSPEGPNRTAPRHRGSCFSYRSWHARSTLGCSSALHAQAAPGRACCGAPCRPRQPRVPRARLASKYQTC